MLEIFAKLGLRADRAARIVFLSLILVIAKQKGVAVNPSN